ncbi:MAG: YfhO family protein [Lachnospiraceae bacterium]
MKKKTKTYNYIPLRGKLVYALAFVIPLIILIVIYFARQIFPFGDKCYLRSDMYHQYLPFYSELWYKLRSHGSLTYSFNIGLGVNFTALYAYYLSSPINWLIFIFPHKYLIEVMNAFIILKICLASVTFTYYIAKRFNNESIFISVFGMFYALSGYLAAYSWNIMWLDCVWLLPLIILGLEQLVTKKKCFLYCITLGLAILSNYYIAIMICLTLVIYFVFLMIRFRHDSIRDFFATVFRFAAYSLLAGGLAACLLLPEMFALSYTVSSDISFPKSLTEYFPIIQMLTRHMFGIETHLALEHHPNIYCGVAVFFLIPLYIMNRKINVREKAGKIALLFVFLIAFNMNIPNFIWHGFHYPNSLPCRQSFIYIFILLTMCYDAFRNIKNYSRKELTSSLWIALGFLFLCEQLFTDDFLDFKMVYISAAFIAAYMLLIYIFRARRVPYEVFLFFFFTITIVECAINFEETALSTTGRTYYLEDNQDIANLLDTADNLSDDFYRVEKISGLRTKNDAAWHDYHSASVFSSTSNGGLSKLYGHLGMESSTNAYSYNGATYLSSALLGVKYLLSDTQLVENTLLSYVASSGSRYLYQNNYTLPLGFMVPSSFTEKWDMKNGNPFKVQNSFISEACGVDDVFVQLTTKNTSSTSASVNVARTQQVYIKVVSSGVSSVNVYINDTSKTYNIKHNHIIDLGVLNSTDDVQVTLSDSSDGNLSIIAYTINQTAFIDAINRLSQNGLEITKMSDTHIEGTITADYDGKMLLSIPYDLGWKIRIDGEVVKQESIIDALTILNVSKGTHTISMDYSPEGFKSGIAITIICVIILFVLMLSKHYPALVQKNKKDNIINDNAGDALNI